jgi:hypothetical protein
VKFLLAYGLHKARVQQTAKPSGPPLYRAQGSLNVLGRTVSYQLPYFLTQGGLREWPVKIRIILKMFRVKHFCPMAAKSITSLKQGFALAEVRPADICVRLKPGAKAFARGAIPSRGHSSELTATGIKRAAS